MTHEQDKANLEKARKLQEEMRKKKMLDPAQDARIKKNLDDAAKNIKKKEHWLQGRRANAAPFGNFQQERKPCQRILQQQP
jgi:hypothetical protein